MSKTAFTIRPASRSDLAAIEALLAAVDLPTAGVNLILDDAPADFLVAVSDGDSVVGVAGLERCGDAALLRSVAVQPEFRSSGVGHDLITRLVADAESRGIRSLYLLTLTAERYFPRFGFERITREEVPAAIAETAEFKSVCPSSATTMKRESPGLAGRV